MMKTIKNRLLFFCGTASLVVGIIGVIVPVLPTTPFLLLAAACYLRSSERFYRWLLNNRIFGIYIRDYIEGRGMPVRTKALTLIVLWAVIGLSVAIGTQNIILRIILLMVAAGVTLHIVLLKVKKP